MNTTYKIENGKVILLSAECLSCSGEGVRPKKQYVQCTKCNGSGKRGKGRCRNCYNEYVYSCDKSLPKYHVMQFSKTETEVCERCNGSKTEEPSYHNYMDSALWESVTFKVYRSQRDISWNEANLGYGCVYSCQDYGRSFASSDTEIIADVKTNKGNQFSKVCQDDGTLCNHIGIFVNRGGYSVRAIFNNAEAIEKKIESEPKPNMVHVSGMNTFQACGII